MTGLLALVANLGLGRLIAVSGEVTSVLMKASVMLFVAYSDITFCVTYTAVVALLATSRTFTTLALVRALTAQMAETTAGVAGLASHSTSTAVVEVVVATCGAVAGDVTRLSALSEV
jgi:hypothetical protein